ncbi:MAG: tyrosine-type recombinase/integrase, partial [Oscillospiraceae bacterium]
ECERYNITGGRRYLFERLEENGTGMPCHPSSVNHYLIEFTKKNGIKHINPHAFRHTCASILLREKTDVVTVGYILGHAKPGTTLNMYGHFIKGAGIEASKTLDKAIFGSKD